MKNSLTTRMMLWVTLSVIAIFTVVSSYDYWFTHKLLNLQLRQLAEFEVSASETEASDMLDRLQHQADLTAALIKQVSPSQEKLESMVATAMLQNEDAYGMAIVVEPGHTEPKRAPYASYFFRGGASLKHVDLASESYDFRQKEWYLQALQLKAPQWTEPYFDEGAGDTLMTTYLVPVKHNDGFTLITIDLAVSALQKKLTRMENKQEMSIYAITPGGHIISGNDESLMLQKLDQIGLQAKRKTPLWFRTLLDEIKNQKSGSFSTYCPKMKEGCDISYAPLGDTRWTMLVAYSHASLTDQLNTYSTHRFLQIALGVLLLALVIWRITRRQFLPLKELDKATQEFAQGKLDYPLPKAPRNDEIGSLTQSFSHMQVSLQAHIKELQRETKQRERINSELRTANEIQQSLLPNDSEVNNKPLGLQLSAYLQPARAVGGDLYYYNIQADSEPQSQRLRFVIGDVSDKGVAAAIFMARVVTAIRAIGEQVIDPAELLTRLNHQLVEDNEACMFVTLLAGTLDLHSGDLQIASAGHPMPYYLRKDDDSIHNTVNPITQLNGPALGLYEYQFETVKMTIAPNSYLFAYTDGLDEATNTQGEFYGEDSIIKSLQTHVLSTTSELISNTLSAVNQFTESAEAADDLTLLAIHWEGIKKVHSKEITISSQQEELEKINTGLNEYIIEHHLAESLFLELQLIAEEIMVNTINYGYDGRADETISVLVSHDKRHITMIFVDRAKAFNPLELGEARLGVPEIDDAVGGLGVHLVKEMCDTCSYEYIAGENRFTVNVLLKKGS